MTTCDTIESSEPNDTTVMVSREREQPTEFLNGDDHRITFLIVASDDQRPRDGITGAQAGSTTQKGQRARNWQVLKKGKRRANLGRFEKHLRLNRRTTATRSRLLNQMKRR